LGILSDFFLLVK